MKQPSVEATPTKVDAEALPHRLTVISSPKLSLKLTETYILIPLAPPRQWCQNVGQIIELICQHLIVNRGS